MSLSTSQIARKRQQVGERLLDKGQTSIGFEWTERSERLVRGIIVWAALERELGIPLLGFYGVREEGREVVITATIEGRNGHGR